VQLLRRGCTEQRAPSELPADAIIRTAGTFEAAPGAALVARLAPALVQGALQAASSQVPGLAELTPASLLPDLDEFPPGVDEDDGLNVTQRRALFEALETVLSVFNDPSIDSGDSLVFPLLPRPSLACITTQVAAALEHCILLRPPAMTASLGERDLDLAAWQRSFAWGVERQPSGRKAELLEELLRSRQRVADLEKDVAAQVKQTELQNLKRKEVISRFAHENKTLQGQLNELTELHKEANERIVDLERRVRHEQWLSEEKGQQIARLEERLLRLGRTQDDILMREKEYGKRILRLNIKEFQGICHDLTRIDRLERALDGGLGEDERPEVTESHLVDLAQQTLSSLEAEFDAHFDERQRRYEQAAQRCESSLEERRRDCEETTKKILTVSCKPSSAMPTQSVAVQTDFRLKVSDGMLDEGRDFQRERRPGASPRRRSSSKCSAVPEAALGPLSSRCRTVCEPPAVSMGLSRERPVKPLKPVLLSSRGRPVVPGPRKTCL